MAEVRRTYQKNITVFRKEHIPAVVSPLLSDILDVQDAEQIVRATTAEASAIAQDPVRRQLEREAYQDFGGLVLRVRQRDPETCFVDFSGEATQLLTVAKVFNRVLRLSRHVERLATGAALTARVKDPAEAIQVLAAMRSAIPIQQEVKIPQLPGQSDFYLNPPPVHYSEYDFLEETSAHHESSMRPLFPVSQAGNAEVDAKAVLEGRAGLFVTDGGLSVIVIGGPVQVAPETTGWDMSIALSKKVNPLYAMPQPFTPEDQQTADGLLGALEAQLKSQSSSNP